jgi:hypothetical protein
MKRVIASILVLMALILAACGGGDDNGDNGDNGDANGNGGDSNETAALSVDNLDQQVALDNTGTLAEDEPFENLVISYPSNWSADQDGFEVRLKA